MENSDTFYELGEDNSLRAIMGEEDSFLDQMKFCFHLDQLYRRHGGDDGLQISEGDYLTTLEETESAYEVNKGTGFENQRKRIVRSLTTSHVQRNEIYSAVKVLCKHGHLEEVIQNLDKKFPEKIWENDLPRIETLTYLFNEQRDCFD